MVKTKNVIAISTPVGESAIGIVRLTGHDLASLMKKVWKGKDPDKWIPKMAQYGHILDLDGKTLDEVMLLYFKSPVSYTGEDMVEIYTHGNPYLMQEVVALFLSLGVEDAPPGEFTKRAYLNGKMDLSQAEAVHDLVMAHSKMGRIQSLNRLNGDLSKAMDPLHMKVIDLIAQIEVMIDHSDEELEFLTDESLIERSKEIITEIDKLLRTSKVGTMTHHGMQIAIVGLPNSGKSSLMNLLLHEDRVIVSDIKGTTRDTISQEFHIDGILLQLIDTAGIRETDDQIENLGIERTKKAIEKADLCIHIFDGNVGYQDEDKEISALIGDKNSILVQNKTDLYPQAHDLDKKIYLLSAKTTNGLEDIEKAIKDIFYSYGIDPAKDVMITNLRQENALKKAQTALLTTIEKIQDGVLAELCVMHIYEAKDALEQITGKTNADLILDEIFAKFCIGK